MSRSWVQCRGFGDFGTRIGARRGEARQLPSLPSTTTSQGSVARKAFISWMTSASFDLKT
jgi:hypothetical protein